MFYLDHFRVHLQSLHRTPGTQSVYISCLRALSDFVGAEEVTLTHLADYEGALIEQVKARPEDEAKIESHLKNLRSAYRAYRAFYASEFGKTLPDWSIDRWRARVREALHLDGPPPDVDPAGPASPTHAPLRELLRLYMEWYPTLRIEALQSARWGHVTLDVPAHRIRKPWTTQPPGFDPSAPLADVPMKYQDTWIPCVLPSSAVAAVRAWAWPGGAPPAVAPLIPARPGSLRPASLSFLEALAEAAYADAAEVVGAFTDRPPASCVLPEAEPWLIDIAPVWIDDLAQLRGPCAGIQGSDGIDPALVDMVRRALVSLIREESGRAEALGIPDLDRARGVDVDRVYPTVSLRARHLFQDRLSAARLDHIRAVIHGAATGDLSTLRTCAERAALEAAKPWERQAPLRPRYSAQEPAWLDWPSWEALVTSIEPTEASEPRESTRAAPPVDVPLPGEDPEPAGPPIPEPAVSEPEPAPPPMAPAPFTPNWSAFVPRLPWSR